jgi:uncharacterized protein involved in exopolysaccharide biosynthesis
MALDNNQIVNSNIDNDEISLKELILRVKKLFSFLLSKWKIIFITSFIGGLLGLALAFADKPTYKATLTFAMEDDKGGSFGGGLSGALGLASSFGIDLGVGGGGAFVANNLAELMKSRLLVEKILLRPIEYESEIISLAEYYIKINKARDGWEKNSKLKNLKFLPGTDRLRFSREQDSILEKIYINLINIENLNIMQKDKKVTIISIEVKSKDEKFSKVFCEMLAEEASSYYIETKSKKARMNVEILQKQVDSVRNELNIAITRVANETDNVYNLNPALNIKVAPSKKKQIDVQTNTSILTNLVVQLELAKITLRKETPLIQLIDRPILPLEKQKLSKLKSLILGGILGTLFYPFFFLINSFYKKIAQY